MPEIPEIKQRTVSVPEIPSWQIMPPQSIPSEPPVTLLLGFPVAEIPGCVETRNTQPGNKDAYDNDPNGNLIVCGANMPSYNPPDFNPALATEAPAPPKTQTPNIDPDDIKEPDVSRPAQAALPNTSGASPDISNLPTTDPPCPPYGAQAIASFNKLGTKVLAGYELQDGKCVKIWDPVPVGQVVNNYIPDVAPTVSIALTAAFATTTAIFAKPIASVLQKLAKPLTKKIVKKINQKLGRREKLESLQQRRASQRHRNQAIRDLRRALGK